MSDSTPSNSPSNQSDQHNQGGLYAFLFSMVFVFSFMFYLVVIDKGVELDEKVVDPALQTGPKEPQFDITKVAEPWKETPEIIAYGKTVFSANCVLCHGQAGKGDGPGGQGLNPRPRNLVEGKWTQGSGLTDHFKVVSNGLPNNSPMVGFKNQIKVADRWALVHFINSITDNKSKEDPAQVAEFAKSYKD
jgi:mono/diheme cytochrome c family protein